MPPKKPKKTEQIILRLDEGLDADFRAALGASGLTLTEGLRLAIGAMVEAHRKYGRIPRDMEIRQALIVDLLAEDSLLGRNRAVAEARSSYRVTKPQKPPIKASPKPGGTGPVALVSDRPA